MTDRFIASGLCKEKAPRIAGHRSRKTRDYMLETGLADADALMPSLVAAGSSAQSRSRAWQETLIRVVAVIALVYATYWIWWRWTYTINTDPKAVVPSLVLILAE